MTREIFRRISYIHISYELRVGECVETRSDSEIGSLGILSK